MFPPPGSLQSSHAKPEIIASGIANPDDLLHIFDKIQRRAPASLRLSPAPP